MIFELISWLYVSLICLIWGNQLLKLFFGVKEFAGIDFSVICFAGMSIIGIISFYISLVIPLYTTVKLALQVPALLVLLKPANRKQLLNQLGKPFAGLSVLDIVFLGASLLMVLFLCTSPVIHPDTLNYHAFSTQIFDKYGSIPGIANLKLQFGFQSLWFAVMAFFDFSIFRSGPWFPLNGCVMGWFIVFLVSKGSKSKKIISGSVSIKSGVWYLFLLLFSILSWTQIRLTASSLSPDFITAMSILLGFYFYIGKRENEMRKISDLLAVFFSIIAVTIKLSAIPVLLIPLLIFGNAIFKRRFLFAGRVSFGVVILLAPIIIRNIISTGYPFYPSSFSAIYIFDWKIDQSRVLQLQHFITSYARYPILMENVMKEYDQSFTTWIPVWWRHLYLIDKVVMLLIVLGALLNLLFFKIWVRNYTRKMITAFVIAVAGSAVWFIKAPDPRFGTGFLLPLIYFQYAPFVTYIGLLDNKFGCRFSAGIKSISTAFILLYVGYRAVYFFHPRQLMFPEGIKNTSFMQMDCDEHIKRMVMNDAVSPGQLPDSCVFFRFRGTTIKAGFKPAP